MAMPQKISCDSRFPLAWSRHAWSFLMVLSPQFFSDLKNNFTIEFSEFFSVG